MWLRIYVKHPPILKTEKVNICYIFHFNLFCFFLKIYHLFFPQALAANKSSLTDLDKELKGERRVRETLEKEKERDNAKFKELEQELDKIKEELQVTITNHIGNN